MENKDQETFLELLESLQGPDDFHTVQGNYTITRKAIGFDDFLISYTSLVTGALTASLAGGGLLIDVPNGGVVEVTTEDQLTGAVEAFGQLNPIIKTLEERLEVRAEANESMELEFQEEKEQLRAQTRSLSERLDQKERDLIILKNIVVAAARVADELRG